MNAQIETLRKLQTLDDGIRNSDAQIAKLQRQVADLDKRLTDLHASLGDTTEDSKVASVALKTKEHELAAVEEHTAKLQVQLNGAKSNKEFTALKHEIATDREKVSGLEDEILQLMERVDGGGRAIEQLKADIEAQEATIQTEKGEIEGSITSVRDYRDTLASERGELVSGVDADYLIIYERLSKGIPNGQAIAAASLPMLEA